METFLGYCLIAGVVWVIWQMIHISLEESASRRRMQEQYRQMLVDRIGYLEQFEPYPAEEDDD